MAKTMRTDEAGDLFHGCEGTCLQTLKRILRISPSETM
jgi:hypothetical protein